MSSEMTKEEKYEYWRMVMDEYESKAISKADYCKQNDIPISTFNYWLDKLDASNNCSNKGRFVELKVRDKKEDSVSIADELVEFIPELNITFNSLIISINSKTPMQLLSDVMNEVGYVKGC